ncbi:MAG TPA: prephenate dehydrogenase [Bacteroidia bacterium]|jgi:prephenate dehydrogenase|nr:prephenate dehydrogenase [Bacteroidia bacterium]
MNVYIIGVGLIGGSLALQIRKKQKDAVIYGIDQEEGHLKKALEIKLIDRGANLDDIADADWIIIAVPVDQSRRLMPLVLDRIAEGALVFDVGSTKAAICESVKDHPKRKQYLATHPIAGTEFSGPLAAKEDLFKGKVNILCETERTDPELLRRAKYFFEEVGMTIRYMNPVDHDKHIAYCSHLSHISSFMLGKTVIDKETNEAGILDMAGSGFASTVRLAKSSPSMWAPIFLQNKENVMQALEEYIANLSSFKDALEQDNYLELFEQMKNANRIRKILDPARHGLPQ